MTQTLRKGLLLAALPFLMMNSAAHAGLDDLLERLYGPTAQRVRIAIQEHANMLPKINLNPSIPLFERVTDFLLELESGRQIAQQINQIKKETDPVRREQRQKKLEKSLSDKEELQKIISQQKVEIEKLKKSIDTKIHQEGPLDFVIVGFPVKSMNPSKVLMSPFQKSPQMDLADILGLITLNHLSEQIQQASEKEVRVNVVSEDAHTLAPLGISPEDIDHFQHQLQSTAELFFPGINFIPGKEQSPINKELPNIPDDEPQTQADKAIFFIEEMEKGRLKTVKREQREEDKQILQLIRGKKTFKSLEFSDEELLNGIFASRTINNRVKTFSKVGRGIFPNAIQLSIHEQDVSQKAPIALVPGSKGTPWHNCAFIDPQNQLSIGHAKDIKGKKSKPKEQAVFLKMGAQSLSLKFLACDEQKLSGKLHEKSNRRARILAGKIKHSLDSNDISEQIDKLKKEDKNLLNQLGNIGISFAIQKVQEETEAKINELSKILEKMKTRQKIKQLLGSDKEILKKRIFEFNQDIQNLSNKKEKLQDIKGELMQGQKVDIFDSRVKLFQDQQLQNESKSEFQKFQETLQMKKQINEIQQKMENVNLNESTQNQEQTQKNEKMDIEQ